MIEKATSGEKTTATAFDSFLLRMPLGFSSGEDVEGTSRVIVLRINYIVLAMIALVDMAVKSIHQSP